MKIVLKIAVVLSVLPIFVLPLLMNFIPNEIPAFVDFFGNPTLMMKTSYLSILRLPLMGILLQIICLIMFSLKLLDETYKDNKATWSIISLIVALKMSLTSFEVLLFSKPLILKMFRLVIFIIVIVGVIVLVRSVFSLYKNYKGHFKDYFKDIMNWKIGIVSISICLYLVLVLLPLYLI